MIFPATLSDITQAHLKRLISEQTLEGPYVDFKRDLPEHWNDGAKHELCADLSAFANSGGGDLLYGIAEDDKAQATTIVPQVVDADGVMLRMLDVLLNGVEPRLPGTEIQPVRVNCEGVDGFVFVLRIPQSWSGAASNASNKQVLRT